MARSQPADDDDDQEQLGDWVLMRYGGWHSIHLEFVAAVARRAAHDWWPTSQPHDAARWNSYHAARKFRSGHHHLRGYKIVNLTKLLKELEEQRAYSEEWINRDKTNDPPSRRA